MNRTSPLEIRSESNQKICNVYHHDGGVYLPFLFPFPYVQHLTTCSLYKYIHIRQRAVPDGTEESLMALGRIVHTSGILHIG